MLGILEAIYGIFDAAWNYFLNVVQSLFMALTFLGHGTTLVTAFSGFLPTIILTGFMLGIGIFLVKFLLGR